MLLNFIILFFNLLAFSYVVCTDDYNIFLIKDNISVTKEAFIYSFIFLLLINFVIALIRKFVLTKEFLSKHLKNKNVAFIRFFILLILCFINMIFLYGIGTLFIKIIISELISLDGEVKIHIWRLVRFYTPQEKEIFSLYCLAKNLEIFNLHRINPISITLSENEISHILNLNTLKEIEDYVKIQCNDQFQKILIEEELLKNSSYFTLKNILIGTSIVIASISVIYLGYYLYTSYYTSYDTSSTNSTNSTISTNSTRNFEPIINPSIEAKELKEISNKSTEEIKNASLKAKEEFEKIYSKAKEEFKNIANKSTEEESAKKIFLNNLFDLSKQFKNDTNRDLVQLIDFAVKKSVKLTKEVVILIKEVSDLNTELSDLNLDVEKRNQLDKSWKQKIMEIINELKKKE